MSNRWQIIDRLIYSVLSREVAVELLVKFMEEHNMYKKNKKVIL